MSLNFRIVTIALLLAAVPAQAQTPESLYPGLRIRVVPVGPSGPVIGSFEAADSSSLRLVPNGRHQSVAIPLDEIRSLYSSVGTYRPLWRGALWGALAGLAVGGGLSLALGYTCIHCVDSDGGAPFVIGFTTFIGSAAGLAFGSTLVRDRWQQIPAPYP